MNKTNTLGKIHHNNGFTLIELMTAVSIVGILSSLSLPFYENYRAKARSAEAKLLLSSIYTAQEGWSAEYDVYSSCIRQMGHVPPASHYYSYGFTNHSQGGADLLAVNNGAPPECETNTATDTFFFQGNKAVGAGAAPTLAETTAANGSNEVAAGGMFYQATSYGYVGNALFAKNGIHFKTFAEAYAGPGGGASGEGGESVPVESAGAVFVFQGRKHMVLNNFSAIGAVDNGIYRLGYEFNQAATQCANSSNCGALEEFFASGGSHGNQQ